MNNMAMNKYTLKFNDKDVELLYQSQSVQKMLKPLHYGILATGLVLNALQLIIRQDLIEKISIINVGFIILSTINLIVLYKKEQLTQLSMTIQNAYILLLQINFQSPSPTDQEYYSYGSSFTSLQVGIYFVSDFKFSCPSIITHIIFRYTVTAYLSQRFSLMLLCLSVLIAIFLISILYICNRAQRLQFLMNIKEDTITRQLETLINKPFSKIKYNNEKLLIDIQTVKSVEKLFGYQEELCQGCNIRNFLRQCKFNGTMLETGLIKNKIPINCSFLVSCKKSRLKIRICQFSIDNSFILIQESIFSQQQIMKQIPSKLKKQLTLQFISCSKAPVNQIFQYGVLSLLMAGQQRLKIINVTKFLAKIMRVYGMDQKIRIRSFTISEIKFKSYYYLFKIFMIQIFNIISEMEYENNHVNSIELRVFDICLMIKIRAIEIESFLFRYRSNFFIQQTSKLLLLTPLTTKLELKFSKILPFAKEFVF